jgi:Predicted double-stranded RNA/RNA-DNA hybrid binding protein
MKKQKLGKENSMGKKVYAIKEGFDNALNKKIENVIVNTWDECLKYVKGVKGAKYKSFEDINSAKQYLAEGSKMLRKGQDIYPEDCLHIYVDGSYNVNTEKYAYGLVAVKNNVIEYIESNASKDNSKSNIRQIAGELEGAVRGVEYALSKEEKKVVIFHDYEGVSHHATGFWERKEQSSVDYYNKMNELFKRGIEVIFVKIDSHTGDLFNELVDEKCKEKLHIQSDKTIEKWLLSNKINVINEDVKNEVLKLASDCEKNIMVVGSKDIINVNEKEKCDYGKLVSLYSVEKEKAEILIEELSCEKKQDFIIYLLEELKAYDFQ